MKRITALFLGLALMLSACGGTSVDTAQMSTSSREEDYKNTLMLEVKYYLLQGEDESHDSSVKAIRTFSEEVSLPDREKFLQIAEHIEKGEVEEVKKLYAELGGEAPPQSKKTDTEKQAAIMALHAMNLYLQAGTGLPANDRESVTKIINSNVILIQKRDSEKFMQAARHIEEDKYEDVEKVFKELLPEYIAEKNKETFDKMGDLKSESELKDAIDQLVNAK
ncbi:hypothetical protein J6TS7_23410 [Paenibacillus dendritiformis]|uniref:hypothetical protein n=1 Tax=Paenibacillus TaxID=44249 RepID=UPI001B0A63A3|nr:hypothetical protein [Paenibacillus dendritiformis]GIO78731.1 hypothetical protein J6TS7_23410 [Paenibacillus dendritiformis]